MSALRTLGAFVRRDARAAASYRAMFVLELAGTLLGFGLLLGLSGLVGRTDQIPGDYLSYALIGVAASRLVLSTAVSAPTRLRAEQVTGTLEILLVTGVPRPLLMAGLSAYDSLRGLLAAALLIGAGVGLGGVDLHVRPVPLLAGLLAVLLLAQSVGLVLAAAVAVFKQAATVVGAAVSALTLLSGAYFPASALPDALGRLAAALPTTWAFDLLRAGTVGGTVPAGETAGLAVACALGPVLASAALLAALDRAARTGTLGQY